MKGLMNMTAKEYLSQAFRIDQRIRMKMEQIDSLRDLVTRMGAQMSDMPKNPNKGQSRTEDILIKIVDMENAINRDIDRLISLKEDIMHTVNKVEDIDCQMVLEKRYLLFETWESIAAEMGYTVRNVHLIHGKALNMIKI